MHLNLVLMPSRSLATGSTSPFSVSAWALAPKKSSFANLAIELGELVLVALEVALHGLEVLLHFLGSLRARALLDRGEHGACAVKGSLGGVNRGLGVVLRLLLARNAGILGGVGSGGGVDDELLRLGVGPEQGELGVLRLKLGVDRVHGLLGLVPSLGGVLGRLGLLSGGQRSLDGVDLHLRRLRAADGQDGRNQQQHTNENLTLTHLSSPFLTD